MFEAHPPADFCRSPKAIAQIDQLIDAWWRSAAHSGDRRQLEITMRCVQACPMCRATMARSVIKHGTAVATRQMQERSVPIRAKRRGAGETLH